MKSAELGNRDAINLIEKTRRNDYVDKLVKIEKYEVKQKNNKFLHDGVKTDRTIPYENTLKRMKSA